MSNRIEVVREIDELNRRAWVFWYYDGRHTLYLDVYAESARATKRHRFKTEQYYSRISSRGLSLSVDDVPLPPDVIDEARQQFIDSLKIEKWQGR